MFCLIIRMIMIILNILVKSVRTLHNMTFLHPDCLAILRRMIMLRFPFLYLFISPSLHLCCAARCCLLPPPWIRQEYSTTLVVSSFGRNPTFVELKICMALLNSLGQGNLKIIVSCNAPSNFSMSSLISNHMDLF